MDSHLIYSVSNSIKHKISWIKVTPDSEWIYFGQADSINNDLLMNTVDKHFSDDLLYIVLTRKESAQIIKSNIEKVITSLSMFPSFLIWDTAFKEVMEFNEIGTMRCGYLNDAK